MTDDERLSGCDRCGEPAKFRVILPDNLDLLFCNHHANLNGNVLTDNYPVLEIAAAR